MRSDSLSLQDRLLRWLKLHPGEWFNGGELERLALNAGYKASNASRRLRELAEWDSVGNPPQIEREERSGGSGGPRSVWYRWNGEKEAYKPVDEWERRGIEWWRANKPEGLPGFIESLRMWHAIPNPPPRNPPYKA